VVGRSTTTHRTGTGGTGTVRGSREESLGMLFETVLTRGPVSRRDAARLTGLSAASVTKLVRPMIEHGYLVEHVREAGVPGRPQIPLEVASSRHFAVGVKVTPHEVIGVLCDLHAEIQASVRQALVGPTPERVVEQIGSVTEELLASCPVDRERVLGVGVGMSGHVNGETGVVLSASLLQWDQVPLRRLLADRVGLPVLIENDVNTLAIAEQWFGPGSQYSSFAVVTVGAGVGCGLVLDGRLWRGTSGAAGEFGHTVIDPHGPLCPCGKRGCVEAYAGDRALVEAMNRSSATPVGDVAEIAARAHEGDETARRVFVEAGTALGGALATLVSLVNPPLVILSGEGVSASDLFMDSLSTALTHNAFSTTADDCTLLVRPLPDETWARGAAAAMLRYGVLGSLGALRSEVVTS
jgi:predicted NBD/HSP70 family sugar kinase